MNLIKQQFFFKHMCNSKTFTNAKVNMAFLSLERANVCCAVSVRLKVGSCKGEAGIWWSVVMVDGEGVVCRLCQEHTWVCTSVSFVQSSQARFSWIPVI